MLYYINQYLIMETQEPIINLIEEIRCLREEMTGITSHIVKPITKLAVLPDAIYTNKELREILGVDDRLIKKYRNEGYISYHRINDKYWYSGKDITEFLSRLRVDSFA